jgi:hypothetical protein
MSTGNKKLKEAIQKLISDSIQTDKTLREKYNMGNKFRFIRDRLAALAARVDDELKETEESSDQEDKTVAQDEIVVYVYIFNAQGLVFQTWQKMLNPAVFYEYSVNRPVYMEKAQVESFIRSKPNKVQHGFLSVIIKKTEILSHPVDLPAPIDQVGNPLVKIKEGCLKFEKMLVFTHQDIEYVINAAGQIVKKE